MLDLPRPDGTQTYRLHDLMHDMARRLLIAPTEPLRSSDLPGLGTPLHEAHSALLERYRTKTRDGLWHTLPDDGYIHNRMIWHLEQSNRIEEVHRVLAEENPVGRNGWFDARERLGQMAGYLTDLARAWSLVTRVEGTTQSRSRMGLQCRYALINASIRSSAGIFPLNLLVTLIDKGVWNQSQALAFARQIPTAKRRADALTRLISMFSGPERRQVLGEVTAAIAEIEEGDDRDWALMVLVPHLDASLVDRAFALTQSIVNKHHKSKLHLLNWWPDCLSHS